MRNVAYDTLPVVIHGNGPTKVEPRSVGAGGRVLTVSVVMSAGHVTTAAAELPGELRPHGVDLRERLRHLRRRPALL